ncbi:MAG: nitroreductase family protein [Anaerolineae bacterium]|jgi:nitroreductase
MGKGQGPIGFVRSIVRILLGRPQVPPSLADNEALQLVLQRRSVRSFTGKEIPDEVFAAILEAGRLAPSTVNLQTWSFATFTPSSWSEVFGRPMPFRGQRAVVVLADTHRARLVIDAFPRSPLVEHTVGVMNASLAAMNMNVAAEVLGVASVMLSHTGRTGLLDCGYLRQKLELPDAVYPLMTMVFGYPRGPHPPMPPKLPLGEICFEGPYRDADRAVMEDWLAQMRAGYRASHPLSSFEAQLQRYKSKMGQAEADLREMIFSD